jgi:hypothetical protein
MNLRSLALTACLMLALPSAPTGAADQAELDDRLARHGQQSQAALASVHRYLHGWLRQADPRTGLIPRNLEQDRDLWNGKDSAADNYPFMVLAAWLTDRPKYEGTMHDMLATETELTSRLDDLVDPWSLSRQAWQHEQPDLERMIFESSEYCKDGLMPVTELLGRTPWFDRMVGLVDSILKHAPVPTPAGPIPARSDEVNGEMMQVTSRLFWMTGQAHYLDACCRMADYYLLGDHHPTRDADVLQLRDHGCELISGLTEAYVAAHYARPGKASDYRQPLHQVLDRVLQVGLNEHGMMYDRINPRTGEILARPLSDNWGYNYNGYYTVYLIDGTPRYRQATRAALQALRPHYLAFPWQGWGSDGLADSVEGAINLHAREPVEGVAEWIEANMTRLLAMQRPDGVIEGWHGDGNFARTAIMYALWKQQGTTIQPWRGDLSLGADRHEGSLHVRLAATRPWQGRLLFDTPRHQTIMRLPIDYPRINQFPEWFTVHPDRRYTIRVGETTQVVDGAALAGGWPLELPDAGALQLTVTPAGPEGS